MRIKREILQYALERVKPGLANKEVIEQSTSFAFINNLVVTYNDQISICHPIEDLNIKGAIQSDKLYALLNKIQKEEVDIDLKGQEIVISAGRMRAGLAIQSEIKLPLDVTLVDRWTELPENFTEAMKFVMTSCGKDMSRPILTCVHVNKAGFVEASDSLRIARHQLSGEMRLPTVLIPASSVVEVVKLNPTKISNQTNNGWVHFQNEEGTTISCRILNDDEYINTSPHLMVKGIEVTLPQVMEEILDRAIIFAKRDFILDERVQITIGNNRLKLRSTTEGGEWYEEEVNMRYDQEPITISVAPYLLKHILSETTRCTISKEKMKFEGDHWIYVTVLKFES